MKLEIFCRCSLFPSWSGEGLISIPVLGSCRKQKEYNNMQGTVASSGDLQDCGCNHRSLTSIQCTKYTG